MFSQGYAWRHSLDLRNFMDYTILTKHLDRIRLKHMPNRQLTRQLTHRQLTRQLTQIFIKFNTKVFVLLIILVNFNLIPTVYSQGTLQSNFDKQESTINASVNNINTKIGESKDAFHDISEQKKTLKEQVRALESEIKSVDSLITEINLTSAKVEGQITELNGRIEVLQSDLKTLIREIQKNDQMSDVQIMLTSQNLGEAYNKIRNLSQLQSRSDSLSKKLVASKVELEENKKTLDTSKKNLQDARFLIASKKDSLQSLLEFTQGEESKYQQLLQGLFKQKTELDAQAAEAERKYKEDLLNQQNNPLVNNPGNGSGISTDGGVAASPDIVGCFFEDKRDLNLPSGYLGLPTSGVFSQDFNCKPGHDGVDIANGAGTALVSITDCAVKKKGVEYGGYGNYILLKCTLPSGKNIYPLYAHMQTPSDLIVGQSVAKGSQVGKMGSTGFSTGTHVHFAILSDTYETTNNLGCHYGSSKCFNPARFINF